MADTTTIERRLPFFCEQYPKNRQKYLRFALMFVRDKAAVEDIVNDSFMKLWENRDSLACVTNLEGYFYTIVKNNCRDWIRNRQTHLKIQHDIHDSNYRLLQYDLSTLDEYDPNMIFAGEIHAILRQQLEKMPKLSREIFIENRFNNMTYENIAQKYDVSVRVVTREIQAALATLRISLSDYLTILVVILLSNL